MSGNSKAVWNVTAVSVMVVSLLIAAGNVQADFVFGEPVNLGLVVNRSNAYFTSISADGLEMYFCSERSGGYGISDIWVSTRITKDSEWGEPTNLGPSINGPGYNVSPCLSGDGLALYFASQRPGGFGLSDIWVARRATRHEDWGAAENLGAPVSTAGDEAFVSISSDELELYFSDWEPVQPGGYGGRDLWVTTRPTVSDPWAPPVRVNAPVNGPTHDEMHTLSSDGLVLLFSSWGRSGGYGARDVWMTRRTTTSSPWSTPVNLGPTINSPDFDQSGTFSPDGSTLYFSSRNRAGGYGGFDIWQAPVRPVVDFNGDEVADVADIDIMIGCWGTDDSLCDIGPMPWGDGIVDIYDLMALAEYVPEIRNPRANAVDVPRSVTLGWIRSPLADTYDVYFGRSLEDVTNADRANPLDVLVGEGQDTALYDPPGLLEFGQTYHWRIDEIGAPPESTVYRGFVWSFTTEPVSYPLENVSATASTSDAGAGPVNTVNGSGLSADDTHSTAATDMWLASGNGVDPIWIQYEFDQVYRLHEMLVWNYNVQFELVLGLGLKDVTVEYSENGTDWMVLGEVEVAQATATATYAANSTIDLGGVAAKYVRLTVNSGWGMMGKFGLSEVRFLYIPARAREPQPVNGAVDVSPDALLQWRPGREAVAHEIYLSPDRQAVIDGTALVDTVTESGYLSGPLDPGQTYYWKVNEVNDAAEATSVWEGDVWEFTTAE